MMMSLVVVIGLVAACTATPAFRSSSYFDGPHYYSSYYPGAVVSPIKSQYHAQNEQGGYAYGYNDGHSTKSETKHANGLTEGSYSYVDPNGVLQAYKYVSDENGYRVTGTNLPAAPAVQHAAPAVAVAAPVYDAAEIPQPVQDTPEVAAAKAAHQVAYEQAKKAAEEAPADDSSSHSEPASDAVEVSAAPAVIKTSPAPVPTAVSYGYPAYAAYPSYAAYAAPAPVASYAYASAPAYSYTAPVASYAYATAPAATYGYAPFAAGSYSPVHSQYHSQDEFGQYSYGYNSGSSSKAEVKTLDGITRGGYSYVDANGIVQQYNYVSDPINGFRVAGTNLPSNSL